MNQGQRIRRRKDDLASYWPSTATPSFPSVALFEISTLCNHACVFCAYPKMTRPHHRMDLPLLTRLLREAYELGTREVGFYSGAEPFTSPHLEEAIRAAKEIGYEYVFISTNGSLASEARLKACMDNGLDSIKFSINGGTRETYRRIHGQDHFERVLARLLFASEYRRQIDRPIYLAVSCVLIDEPDCSNQETQQELRDVIGDLVDEVVFYTASNENGQMIGLASMGIEPPCSLPFARLHISAEGYLGACCNDYQNYLAVADLKETPLAEAWNSDVFRTIRQRHLDKHVEGKLCHNCIHNVNTPIEPLVLHLAVPTGPEFFQFKNGQFQPK